MIYHDFLFLDFFAPQNKIFLILIGWLQIFSVRKNAGFSLVYLNFSRLFSALWRVRKNSTHWMFGAMGSHRIIKLKIQQLIKQNYETK